MADPGRIPGSVVIPATVQVVLNWTLPSGKTVHNVLHALVGSGFAADAATAQAIYAAIIASAGWTAWKARINSGVSFAGVSLRDLRAAFLPLAESTGAATPGTGAGTALPPGNALVVTLRTANAGRGFRGRVYLPGLDTGALAAGGVAAAGTMTDAAGFVSAVSAALTASGGTLAIAQPARAAYTGSGNTPHSARSAAAQTVTSIVVRDNTIDSQRRRAQV